MKLAGLALVLALAAVPVMARPAVACGFQPHPVDTATFSFIAAAKLPAASLARVHYLDDVQGFAVVEIRWTPEGAKAAKAQLLFLRRGDQMWTVGYLGPVWPIA